MASHLRLPGLAVWSSFVVFAALSLLLLSSATFAIAIPSNLSLGSNIFLEDSSSERAVNHWVDSWASMPQLTEPANLPPSPFNGSNVVFRNSTIRQTIRLTMGGDQFRIRISNVFGGSDLPITAVSVALPTGGAAGVSTIQTSTFLPVTFGNQSSVVVPLGALVLSDPINISIQASTMLAITIYTQQGQSSNSVTSHPGSRTTTWFCTGNYVNSADLSGGSRGSVAHWYFLSAVEVWAPLTSRALIIVGDSITDGRGSVDNQNNRWPDLVANKLQQNGMTSISVINQGAGGNRILNDGLGPNALGRIDRDVISQPGVYYALLFIGVNDIGTETTAVAAQNALSDRLIWAFGQMVEHLHSSGIVVFGATITPFTGTGQGYSDPNREATRTKVNNYIRTSGVFDAVVDFDRILADPARPAQLNPRYDSGDALHPNVAGYQALADNFPLDIFSMRL